MDKRLLPPIVAGGGIEPPTFGKLTQNATAALPRGHPLAKWPTLPILSGLIIR